MTAKDVPFGFEFVQAGRTLRRVLAYNFSLPTPNAAREMGHVPSMSHVLAIDERSWELVAVHPDHSVSLAGVTSGRMQGSTPNITNKPSS